MRLHVHAGTHSGNDIVAADGEIDLATAPSLREAISEQLAAGHVRLLLDLRAVTFMDSTGLGVLVGANKSAVGLGGSLRVVCDNPRILRILAVTGLSKSLGVYRTLEEAVEDWSVPAT